MREGLVGRGTVVSKTSGRLLPGQLCPGSSHPRASRRTFCGWEKHGSEVEMAVQALAGVAETTVYPEASAPHAATPLGQPAAEAAGSRAATASRRALRGPKAGEMEGTLRRKVKASQVQTGAA